MLFSGWLNTSGGRMKLAWMEMSNIERSLSEAMTRYKMRVTTKTYYTRDDVSTEGSLVHRLSNHRNLKKKKTTVMI